MSDKPRSALEIVMERLRKKDAEAGVEETTLTDAQRAAIAEARSIYEARVAERRIMHKSALATVFDPAEREQLEQLLRRDLDRFESDRDARIKRIREGGVA
jgi:DNA-binding MarR family transcriptional regulator